MAATLSPKSRGVPVDAGTELAASNGFTSADDVGTDYPCYASQVEILMPAGETAALSKITAAGGVIPILNVVTSGVYLLGEHWALLPGEYIRAVSSSVQAGDREFRVKAARG